eukprot:6491338-Amphidinium_carterae.2
MAQLVVSGGTSGLLRLTLVKSSVSLLRGALTLPAFLPPGLRLAGLFGNGTQVTPGTLVRSDIPATLPARHARITISKAAYMRPNLVLGTDDLRAIGADRQASIHGLINTNIKVTPCVVWF